MSKKKLSVCKIVTAPISLYGLSHSLKRYKDLGVDLTILCSNDKHFIKLKNDDYYHLVPFEIKREISPFYDLMSLIKLVFFLRKNDFDIIHSNTPKAGLITAIAARIANKAIVFHTFTGQRWVTMSGFKRKLLIACDKIIVYFNTHCFADSNSQVEFLRSMNIGSKKNLSCIGHGSHAGVDLDKFNFSRYESNKGSLRDSIGIGEKDIVLAFLGRIVQDKGISELVNAFLLLKKTGYEHIKLLLMGPFEDSLDPLDPQLKAMIAENKDIIHLGMVDHPEKLMIAADIFCIPSYREGFPTVILEANAMKIPSVGSAITGLVDTIVDKETGLLCHVKDHDDLAKKIATLIDDEEMRIEMGLKAYERVKNLYSSDYVTINIINEYKKWIKIDEATI